MRSMWAFSCVIVQQQVNRESETLLESTRLPDRPLLRLNLTLTDIAHGPCIKIKDIKCISDNHWWLLCARGDEYSQRRARQLPYHAGEANRIHSMPIYCTLVFTNYQVKASVKARYSNIKATSMVTSRTNSFFTSIHTPYYSLKFF